MAAGRRPRCLCRTGRSCLSAGEQRASVCLDSVMKLKSYFDHMKVCKVKLTVDRIRHEDLQRADNFESVDQ